MEAGVYEGGRELWECAIDLVEWLAAHRRPSGTVLELGCGRGLPGLWCLKRGAQQVVFSDYDADVLERYTRRDAARVGGQCYFYAGDWRGLPAALSGGRLRGEVRPDPERGDGVPRGHDAFSGRMYRENVVGDRRGRRRDEALLFWVWWRRRGPRE